MRVISDPSVTRLPIYPSSPELMAASPPASPARIPGYDLEPLTEADVRAMLARVFGSERASALWTDARRAAAVGSRDAGTPEELRRVAAALGEMGGAMSTIARTIDIRLRTYARLAARSTTQTGARA